MALLTPQQISATGLLPVLVAAAGGGDTIAADDRTFLYIVNGDASSKTVTVVVPGTEYGQARADVAIVVAAGQERFIGPLVADLATAGLVSISYSAVTSVTVAAVRA